MSHSGNAQGKIAVFGLGVILIVIIMAVTANFLYPFDPFRLAGKPLSGPGMNGFLLGSDRLDGMWPPA